MPLMTPMEIVADYKQAKNKKAQIRTLAELNACDEERILEILVNAGELKKETLKPSKATAKTRKRESTAACEEKKDVPDMALTVTLTPGEAETLADYIGLTLLPSIRMEEWGIENPEYIGDLSSVYAKCLKLVERTGRSTFSGTFQSERRGMYGKDVWEDDAADKME